MRSDPIPNDDNVLRYARPNLVDGDDVDGGTFTRARYRKWWPAYYVAVIYQGEIVEQGPAEQVLKNPRNDYTKKLLSAVPRVEKVDR